MNNGVRGVNGDRGVRVVRVGLRRRHYERSFAIGGYSHSTLRVAWVSPCSLPPIASLHWGLFIFNPSGCAGVAVFAAPNRFASLGVIHIQPFGLRGCRRVRYPQSLRFIGGYSHSTLRVAWVSSCSLPPIASLHWGLFIFNPSGCAARRHDRLRMSRAPEGRSPERAACNSAGQRPADTYPPRSAALTGRDTDFAPSGLCGYGRRRRHRALSCAADDGLSALKSNIEDRGSRIEIHGH
jgi:fluoride ion exporter CrcB/FEX